MSRSKKFVANAMANAQLNRNGWKEGTRLRHRKTGTEILLGIRNDDGSFWGMTISPTPKKGRVRPIDLVNEYVEAARG